MIKHRFYVSGWTVRIKTLDQWINIGFLPYYPALKSSAIEHPKGKSKMPTISTKPHLLSFVCFPTSQPNLLYNCTKKQFFNHCTFIQWNKNTFENSGTKYAINTSVTHKLFLKINRIHANKIGYIHNTARKIHLLNTFGYFIK